MKTESLSVVQRAVVAGAPRGVGVKGHLTTHLELLPDGQYRVLYELDDTLAELAREAS